MSTSMRVRRHLRANVVGYVALFFAVGGGTALATHGAPNSISSEDIINGEVQTADVATDGITSPDIATGAVNNVDIADGQVMTADIGDGQVRTADVQNGAVTQTKLSPDSVGTNKVIDESLSGADLLNGSIQPADISTNYDALVANDAYGRFHDAEMNVPDTFSPIPAVLTRTVPAGSWFIFAKGHINFNGPTSLSCELRAGADRDGMVDRANADGADALPGYGVIALTVLHQSASSFNAELACTDFGATSSAVISQMKIHAIEVQSIENTAG